MPNISGQVKGKEKSVTVTAFKGTTQVASQPTDNAGKYSLAVPQNDEYTVTVVEAAPDSWAVVDNNRYVEVEADDVDKVNFKTVAFTDTTQEQNNDEVDKQFVKDLLFACLSNADDWMTPNVQQGRIRVRKVINDGLRRKGEPA